MMAGITKHKEIKNDVCGSYGCTKSVSRRVSFPIAGFSAGFCSERAEDLAQDNIGIENEEAIPDDFHCNNGCGLEITFDESVCSYNGKLIPLGENGLPHDCPSRQSETNPQQDSKPLTASDLTVSSDQVRYMDSLGRSN
jgi:hypothetical protein